ncbi:Uncharacterized protein C20H4.06c [Golovinomyces cichoracearum]|uniref:Uncharacterized protein C20H4.06c n=1 Tax=Golovinomyces cichoracearum TaxID=62708 RepID=A0A420IFJ8_9PEZI|nr:Uncharacterized protein C20H4.06c [Golovinomyces cichoracearum]
MTYKRSRETYEANLQAEQSPFVVFGTPLPPQDPDVRDDGSYVPVWKQEVRDERGLKRLHGAFTGGFSAGYFNTVGSKEGWTPASYTSSRSKRDKNGSKITQQKPEDFMDEEDIRDAEDARKIETSARFSGLGSTHDDNFRKGVLVDLLRMNEEKIGVKLLQKMGWKEGEGIGRKVRRTARLGDLESTEEEAGTTFLFAPENTTTVKFDKKNDQKGLGYHGETKPQSGHDFKSIQAQSGNDYSNENPELSWSKFPKKKNPKRTGIGVGILNDTGSDDEDPYEIGPRISYNLVIGIDKKKKSKKKPENRLLNPLVETKPIFFSKKATLSKSSTKLQKCFDGNLPLDGFVLGKRDDLSSIQFFNNEYEPPHIPDGWKSTRASNTLEITTEYKSTSDIAKLSKLNFSSRASILGESSLPGKSVFDFLTPAARDRVAAASGKHNLPAALGQVPKEYEISEEERRIELITQIPKLDKLTADAALSRGTSGFMPYGDDLEKRKRYRAYLEFQAGIITVLPSKDPKLSGSEWLQELREFSHCAQLFKPMSGSMATRFAPSSGISQSASSIPQAPPSLLSKPIPKVEDPAEQAAKLSMYGPLTRQVKDWYPSRLLCKRFNIHPPKHVTTGPEEKNDENLTKGAAPELVAKGTLDSIMRESCIPQQGYASLVEESAPATNIKNTKKRVESKENIVVDPGRNDALEGQRAGDAVFRAIFGDDSDDN